MNISPSPFRPFPLTLRETSIIQVDDMDKYLSLESRTVVPGCKSNVVEYLVEKARRENLPVVFDYTGLVDTETICEGSTHA